MSQKYSHTFKYVCIYDIKLTNIISNEIINISISDESFSLYEINKKLTLARQIGLIFNQINKLTIKMYSHLRYKNISYYLKHRIPMGHRLFFRRISQNKEYVKKICNHLKNLFHFACQKWIKNCM